MLVLYIHFDSRTMSSGDGTFYKGIILLGVTFSLGFVAGYKAKEWRMEWLKRRRERLAVKLQETQREIEAMKAH